MNFQKLGWHKECLKSLIEYAENLKKQSDEIRDRRHQIILEINTYTHQIARAEKEGKHAFDKDSYDIKKDSEGNDKSPFCEYCSLKCIASDCECTCHKKTEVVKKC